MRVDGIAHFQGMVGLRLCYHISVYQTHLCDNDGVYSDDEEPDFLSLALQVDVACQEQQFNKKLRQQRRGLRRRHLSDVSIYKLDLNLKLKRTVLYVHCTVLPYLCPC